MSEIETLPASPETQSETDPIEVIYQGDCPSLSERSTLTYTVGRHPDGTLHLRITDNSGKGMWCDEWIPGTEIDAVVVGGTELTSRAFQVLKPGRSTNTAGFVMAAVKSLELIRTNAENTRLQEHVPTETFEKVVTARISQASGTSPQKARRKAKES